ncbi:MAG: hypothetical protein IPP14_15110 [Planctomycetes bacterium]|nr:hypothetical protein [Planctomycetota bacterium]
MKTFREKLEVSMRLIEKSGVKYWGAGTPLHRLAWKLGIPIPPPPLAGFWTNAAFFGGYFSVFFGVITHLVILFVEERPRSVTESVLVAALAGVLFGAWMGFFQWRVAIKHRLPMWSEIDWDDPTN